MKRLFTTACAALALLAPASALSVEEANKAIEAFVAAPGYAAFDVDTIHDAGSPYEKNFPTSGAAATHADAMVGPIEKALLLVNSYEETSPERVRYAISYSHVIEEADGGSNIVMLVEVRRYNLGPLIRKQTAEEYGPENTAGPEDFGVGPDVAWRFAFSTVMGNSALALSGSRRVIADGEAQLKEDDAAEACISGPCRSLASGAMDYAPKGAKPAEAIDMPGMTVPYTITYGKDDMTGLNAPFVARNLQALLGIGEGGDWATPETPESAAPAERFLVMQIDQNLGQDIFSQGVAGLTHVNDDAIRELWVHATFWNGQSPSDTERLVVGR